MRAWFVFSSLLFLTACVSAARPNAAETAALAQDGREIAEAQCASCHAVGGAGHSPNPAAPRFDGLLSRYHADVLEHELIEGVRVTHPMPEFQFNPKSVDALVAYLRSIQRPAADTPDQ
jgi:cytochrome c